MGRKDKLIIAAVTLFILIGAGGSAFAFLHFKPKAKPVAIAQTPPPAPTPPPSPTVAPVVSPLTGLPVSSDVLLRPVTGVMIENSPDARPQSALDQAGIVFEAVAEGGITRFLALFQDTQPTYIGPVRSARPYYLQWCLAFDCALAHAGGSPEALNDIPAWGVKNLDEFAYSGYYRRISSRYAPHNLYTGQDKLNSLESKLGFGAAKFTSLLHKPDAPSKTPNASHIDINISSALYEAHFDYDAGINGYDRSEGGQGHVQIDGSGKANQIKPKVVAVLVMPQGIEADDQHTSYGTIGSGAATFFQDGTVSTGQWHKDNINGPLTLTDANGQPMKLNAGQTWFTVIGAANRLTYKP